MRKIVTAAQMRAMEEAAFSRGVSRILLMEYAAGGVLNEMEKRLGALDDKRLLFVCGGGNNGGDGYAIARMALIRGANAVVWQVLPPLTDEARENERFFVALGGVCLKNIRNDDSFDAVVDCLFGTGLSRAPEGVVAEALLRAAGRGGLRIAVDVPSGLDATSGQVYGACFPADVTVTLGFEKTGLYLTKMRNLIGDIAVCPLPLPDGIDSLLPDPPLIAADESDLPSLIPKRAVNASKGDCGRVLLYCGSLGMAGAAAMAAKGALRAGAGLVTVACPEEIIPILQTLVPNAMCAPVHQIIERKPAFDALLMGCGLTATDDVWRSILSLYDNGIPTVWDADALNLLARHPMPLSQQSVLTPHPGEAARLLNTSIDAILDDPLKSAERLSERYSCRVVLKNAVSVIAKDGKAVALNTVGTPALAKGGSGDGLAGVLTAFLAQGIPSPLQAACLVQGTAAIKAEQEHGTRGLLTGEWLDEMGI